VAEREHQLEILRGSQHQETIRRVVDEEDEDGLVRIGQLWLRNERIDRDLWHRFTLTVLNGRRLVEVNLG
jgi:hypothetical protein